MFVRIIPFLNRLKIIETGSRINPLGMPGYMNVCIIGCGSIGSVLARALSRMEEIQELYLMDRTREEAGKLAQTIPGTKVISELQEVREKVELVIEAASQDAVRRYAEEILEMGMNLMIMSVGALADDRLFAAIKVSAKKNGVKIYIPSGAIGGLDVIHSASIGSIDEISLKTSKPPQGLLNNSYIMSAGIDVEKIERPTVVFDGNVTEAIQVFPLNINVASILALAVGDKEKIRVRIIVDPDIDRNVHQISMKGEFGAMRCTVQNRPHPANPKTSYLAALSAIAMVENIVGVINIGS